MPTDSLTKAIPTQKYATFIQQLNLVEILEKLGQKKAGGDDNRRAHASNDEEGEEDGGRLGFYSDF
jgi:hypothetical protein